MEPRESRKPVEPGIPPPQLPRPVQELNYSRQVTGERYRAPLLFPAGFLIGFAVYFACCAGAWAILSFTRVDGGGILCSLIGIPLAAILISGILQSTFEWRGVFAGVAAAFGLSILLSCVGLAILCGGLR